MRLKTVVSVVVAVVIGINLLVTAAIVAALASPPDPCSKAARRGVLLHGCERQAVLT